MKNKGINNFWLRSKGIYCIIDFQLVKIQCEVEQLVNFSTFNIKVLKSN